MKGGVHNLRSQKVLFDLLFLDLAKFSTSISNTTVLMTIRHVLVEPNPDNPLEAEIANQFKENRARFNETAKEWTRRYATK